MVKQHIAKIPTRGEDTQKGDFGHVFVLAGSAGMTGAAYLTSQAAIRSGSGLVTCGIPKSLNLVMEAKLTEVMTLPLPEAKGQALCFAALEKIVSFSEKINSLAVGPGISRNKDTGKLVREVIKKVNRPLVLDADGIVSIVGKCDLLQKRKAPTILTPHPGEMARLLGKATEFVQAARVKLAKDFAKKHKVVLVLKGYRTIVASPKGEIYLNETGNSGMSTAGVGDVLTGMIASFVGQGIEAYSAAVIGTYLHGKAGDLASRDKGQFGMIASDLLEKLPEAIIEEV
ncbi:MAG: NAD(P)H-hydrate dehydratase [Candidatus Omnitrophica bacterium]|nr:NAD(P)H-hydrate dehydratase [Candidatus Omnitrophota bacterium]